MGGLICTEIPNLMRKLQYKRANGDDWAGFPYRSDVTVDEVASSGSTPGSYGRKSGSSGIWPSVIDNAGGWINSIGQTITGSIAAKNPVTVQDNTPRVLAIAGVGVAAVVLVIALLVIFKK